MMLAWSACWIEVRPHRWSDWKIVLKTAEFKREDWRKFVCDVATSSDIHMTGNWRARDTR
jgi:hypothetical protein